jgi:hypothetical protein
MRSSDQGGSFGSEFGLHVAQAGPGDDRIFRFRKKILCTPQFQRILGLSTCSSMCCASLGRASWVQESQGLQLAAQLLSEVPCHWLQQHTLARERLALDRSRSGEHGERIVWCDRGDDSVGYQRSEIDPQRVEAVHLPPRSDQRSAWRRQLAYPPPVVPRHRGRHVRTRLRLAEGARDGERCPRRPRQAATDASAVANVCLADSRIM